MPLTKTLDSRIHVSDTSNYNSKLFQFADKLLTVHKISVTIMTHFIKTWV